jgi:hypothetical protein
LSLTSSRQVWWCTNNGLVRCFNSGTVPLNAWSHIVGTWDGTIMRSYINGSQVGSMALSGTVTEINNDALIGAGVDVTEPQYFDGIIDELKVYSKALTAAEVQAEYASNSGTASALVGLSGYPTSTSWLDQIISVMSANGMNVYRMSANPEWFSSKPHPYHSSYVQYFLDHAPSDWVIIVDRNHIYPPNEQGASDFRTNIVTARNSILEVCNAWPNNPRVWIELANEYVSTDFNSVFQDLIDDVRNAGCSNTLVIDKWNTAWSSAVFSDPYSSVYTGMHFYFNSWSVSGATTQMNYALDRYLKVINTEVGADSNEASQFSQSEVQELSDFLQWSADNGIGNTIWMNENLDNWQTYQNLGLVIPNVQSTAPSGTIVSTELINFYSMTTSEIQTFLNLVKGQDMPLIIIRLNAMNEFQSGTSSGITKAKQIIQEANSRGIQVAVDLHTWYTTWDNYFRDAASNYATYRSQYITYVRNVLSSFSGSNVYSFMVLNEPQARTATSSENQFIINIVNAAKEVTNRPVSVRFMCGYSPSTGHYSSQIDQATDYLSRNVYWDPRNPSVSVYGTTEAKVNTAISTAHNQGKEIWITEFGKTNSNLEEQRAYVEAFVAWAKQENVDDIFCWVSQPDSGGESYNIFNGYTPNPAFYELVND